MSDHRKDHRTDRSEGDWGETDLDPREQEEADRTLDDPDSSANEPWSPPDRMPRGSEFIGADTSGGESLDQRIHQEVPEEGTAYGAPSRQPREEMVGGDDPDAIPADEDVLGGPWDEDAGAARERPGSPEESAMHVVGDETDD